MRQTLCLIVTCASLVWAVGCGKGQKLVSVKGTVYLDGKAVKTSETVTGYVVFHADASKGNTNMEDIKATIEADGTYTIYTRNKEGAPPGWYFVTVELAETNPNDPYHFKPMIPDRYLDRTRSKLAIEVVANPESGRYDLKIDPR